MGINGVPSIGTLLWYCEFNLDQLVTLHLLEYHPIYINQLYTVAVDIFQVTQTHATAYPQQMPSPT